MAAPLHASVSGEVLRVEEVNNQGRNILACIIKRGIPQNRMRRNMKASW